MTLLVAGIFSDVPKDVHMKALVVGLARSGRAAVGALAGQGWDVVAYDRSVAADASGLAGEVRLGPWDDGLLDEVDLVVKSPGVPSDSPPVVTARTRGIELISEIELGARLLPNPILGVTGTNGKTTTTALLGAMFDAAGVPAEVAGNIGRPLTSLAGMVDPDAWIVCELSSFQLEDIDTLHPRIAILLNLEPDHLDRHGSFEAYRAAKLRIFENQGGDDISIVPRGFAPVPGAGRRIEFDGADALPAEPLVPGAHNRENAAAAVAAARAAGIPDEAIAEALRTFPGVEHRIEELATIAGVRYVNDSKATNVAAALRALASFPGVRKLVILGGRGKAEPYAPLAEAFEIGDRAYLIGEATEEMAAALEAADVEFERSGDLPTAVAAAALEARDGDVVLLSPACASFDQFTSYEQRGEEFGKLVQKLTG
jgi:UDP-N-acetylmuramoylalanine--D-glutamate ligase